ncbi:MAG: helix-turn-helix domain-containing protein [Thermoleophilia bacterium]
MVGGDTAASESLGDRLKRLRMERGLSQRAISAPGVGVSYISRIEAGTRQPSLRALRALADRLGVSAEYLETGRAASPHEEREVRLADAELALRLGEGTAVAEAELERLLAEAEEAGDTRVALRARIALGLAASQAGRHRAAVEHLERCVRRGAVTPVTRPDVYVTLGASYVAVGRHDLAVGLFEDSLAAIEEHAPEDDSARIRFVTHLSYALSDRGDFERAREVLATLDGAAESHDPYSRIRIFWSQARLASMEGDTGEALDHLNHAMALLDATEDTLNQARAHLLCVEILLLDGDVEQAGKHLAQAERLYALGASALDLGSLRAQQGKHAALLGRAEQAVEFATEAIGLLHDHPVDQAAAWHALALARAGLDDTEGADQCYRRAVDQLASGGEWREAVQACQAWAETLRKAGRHEQAYDVLQRATELGLNRGVAFVRAASRTAAS